MIKLVPIFKVRIVYKSGYVHDFEAYEFHVKGGSYTWTNASDKISPSCWALKISPQFTR